MKMHQHQHNRMSLIIIISILLLLISSTHGNGSNFKIFPWAIKPSEQPFRSKRQTYISTTDNTKDIEDEVTSSLSNQIITNETDQVEIKNESSASPNKRMKLYNYILSSALNVILGDNDMSNTHDTFVSDYYYPQASPGLLSLCLRLLFLSWITSFWNNQDMQPYIPKPEQHYTFENLNERYKIDNMAISKILNQQSLNQKRRFFSNNKDYRNKELVVVIDLYTLDNPALVSKQIDELCDKVTFILRYAALYHQVKNNKRGSGLFSSKSLQKENDKNLEVIFRLESPGGSVQDYALASAQIQRLRNNDMNITVTCCVDKFAASGGYMIASQANKIVAAPFAILGSIGVIGQIINVNDLLINKVGIQPLQVKSGKYKSPISMISNVTKYEMDLWEDNVHTIHSLFIKYVMASRELIIENNSKECYDKIIGGDTFLASQALEMGLVDDIKTSDEYILDKLKNDDTVVLKMIKYERGRTNWFFSPTNSYISSFRNYYPGLLRYVRSFLGTGVIALSFWKNRNNPMLLLQCLERSLCYSSEWIRNLTS